MTERPILFSAPMVLALLAGTKTQTRRIVKFRAPYAKQPPTVEEARQRYGLSGFTLEAGFFDVVCPYGMPRDRLWVKETFALSTAEPECGLWEYRADNPDPLALKWKPSIFMPRKASRLTLEVTGVRVQPLQEISPTDAIAEGVERTASGLWRGYQPERGPQSTAFMNPAKSYESPWESINGAGSWAANPWVWVIEFKRVTP